MLELARFSLRLVCGIGLMWCVMPRREVSSGFFRIQMLVALGLSVLGAVAFGPPDAGEAARAWNAVVSPAVARTLSIVLAVAAFLGSVVWTLERRTAGTWFVFAIAGVATATLLLALPRPDAAGAAGAAGLAGPSVVLAYAAELSAAALLGAALVGMLLGHWYLTAPMMSLAPLERLTSVFGVAAAARLLTAGAGLCLAWGELAATTHVLWLALRWTAGVIAPLVLYVMVRRILRYRNTQAATGVLFVAVILTFIGEMTALLLEHDLGRPL